MRVILPYLCYLCNSPRYLPNQSSQIQSHNYYFHKWLIQRILSQHHNLLLLRHMGRTMCSNYHCKCTSQCSLSCLKNRQWCFLDIWIHEYMFDPSLILIDLQTYLWYKILLVNLHQSTSICFRNYILFQYQFFQRCNVQVCHHNQLRYILNTNGIVDINSKV